ncbi:hypothetical protein ABEB36_005673 [Hypothenemus hampei]|uniref:Uncharacterized protein n=1 Tax=Hypothenemus hampei TaxID=57062 RepID=A0ABD1EZP1_HYPHA
MQSGRRMRTKEIGINANRSNEETDITTSETNNDWKSPTKLKQDVQTIIDIMETTITPYNYNTSSDADNEESVLTNSKLSMNKSLKKSYLCNEDTETKSKESTDKTSKENLNISTAADVNSTLSVTMDEFTDSKFNFPYVENICNNNPYICPPPLIPANVCINSECICPQVASILHGRNIQLGNEGFLNLQEHNIDLNISNENKVCKTSKNVVNWFKTLVSTSKSIEGGNNICGNEYYKMNIKRKRGNDHSPPKRVVFELVQNYPKTCNDTCNNLYDSKEILCESTTKENLKNERLQAKANLQCFCKYKMEKDLRKPPRNIEKNEYCDHSGRTRVDFYYFDHGASNYYQTTDASPVVTTQEVADKTEKYTTRFWAEIFGTVHIGLSFFTSFILQFLRLILYSICRPLTIGFIQLGSDYVFKPLLASLFNGLLQPIFIFFYNIFGSIRDICDPISEGIGYFFKEFSILIRAFRIVEIKNENCGCQNECKCEKKSKKSKLSH